jgi:hypothetical protein
MCVSVCVVCVCVLVRKTRETEAKTKGLKKQNETRGVCVYVGMCVCVFYVCMCVVWVEMGCVRSLLLLCGLCGIN